jgi:hypothetical protein
MVEQEKNHFRCLTLTSFVDGLSGNNLIGTVPRSSREIEPGPLSHPSGDPAKTREKAVVTISEYLNLFAENLEEHWRAGDEKSGYLCTNLGIRALLLLFRRIVAFVETQQNFRARAARPEDIIEAIEPYVTHVVEYFKTATANDIAGFRGRGSSLSSVDQNCFQMMVVIHDADPSFQTRELTEYIGRQDVEGTKEAKLLIDEINKIIFENVVSQLQEKYGTARNAWWEQGIPKKIKIDSYQRYTESDDDHREVHQFLTLSNYPEILQFEDNWEEFKDYYSFPENKTQRKKADQVSWIRHVNIIRNITHHVEKGPLLKGQVDYIRRAHQLVKTHIAGRRPVSAGSSYLPSEEAQKPADEAAQ